MQKENKLPEYLTMGELYKELFFFRLTRHQIPGYFIGLERSENAENRFVSHVYNGLYDGPMVPMCARGYNRGKDSFSIFRNNLGRGICKVCLKNTLKKINA